MPKTTFPYPENGPHAIRPWAVRKGHGDEHFLSDYRYMGPREDPDLPEAFVYTTAMSFDPGETVEFHGSSTAKTWNLQIYRDGHVPEMVHEAFDLPGRFTPTSPTAYMDGCDWPVVHSWTIPKDQRPGFYLVVTSCVRPSGERFLSHHFVVVRATPETQRGKILLMLCTGTWTSYNDWGGANHYFGTWGPNGNEPSPHLSLHRPWTRGLLWLPKGAARVAQPHAPAMNDLTGYPSKEWGYSQGFGQYYAAAGWAQFDRHFAVWAEKEGYDFDIITQTDLHYRPEILDRYSCLVTVGHDEYWSWEMRQTVEDFVEKGGNFSRFGGNFLWQIRLEDDGARQVCWKVKAPEHDPMAKDPATKHLATASWESGIVNWPGASTTGVNGCHGMYASWGGFAPRGSRGFTVYRPDHWAFDGTDLRYADVFGAEAGIFGYEVDGLDYTVTKGLPYPVAAPGVPDNIEILAMSPATLFEYEHMGPGYRYYVRDSDLVGLAELAEPPYEEARRNFQYGAGMVVSMTRGKGEVFCAGTCEWVMGLTRRDSFTEEITRNALDRFSAS
ncbi:N,N-dimethylformamidase beta subunit family domain-containing protein [Chachezhania sediminis]|uniref:N,N-dimethylformamidase beta subunit family domain-containing protein n=1 Tax=Chachezhania sediminis TaxID=2599291 RepID=UPI00131E5F1A|nr:N,N-dimethylformamidase beta subunit family domain-containing protein [Chachezhania sediminis]